MKPRYFILVAVGSVAVALGVLFATALKKHNNGLAKIERIPDITLTTIDGEDFSVVGLNPEHKTAILFFSPDCEFCRKELEGVVFYKDSFADIDWVFVTFLPREDLDEFLLEYPLYAIPGAKITGELPLFVPFPYSPVHSYV